METPKSNKSENSTSTCPDAPVKFGKEQVDQIKLLRHQVEKAISVIRDYKRKQKALYRAYYQHYDCLKEFVEKYKDDAMVGSMIEFYLSFDDEDIFYKKNKD